MVCCCIMYCNNRSERKKKDTHGITFHIFPRNASKRKSWIIAVNRKNWKPSSTSVICSKHFDESCFYKTKKGLVRLQEDSVPTLHIPNDKTEKNVFISGNDNNQINIVTTSSSKSRHDFPVLRVPVIEESDTPKTKILASHIKRMLFLCKKQRRAIRLLHKKIRAQEILVKKHNSKKADCMNEIDSINNEALLESDERIDTRLF